MEGAPHFFSSCRERWLPWGLDLVVFDALISSHTSTGTPFPPAVLKVYIENKALVTRIQKWGHQGLSGTLAPEFD